MVAAVDVGSAGALDVSLRKHTNLVYMMPAELVEVHSPADGANIGPGPGPGPRPRLA